MFCSWAELLSALLSETENAGGTGSVAYQHRPWKLSIKAVDIFDTNNRPFTDGHIKKIHKHTNFPEEWMKKKLLCIKKSRWTLVYAAASGLLMRHHNITFFPLDPSRQKLVARRHHHAVVINISTSKTLAQSQKKLGSCARFARALFFLICENHWKSISISMIYSKRVSIFKCAERVERGVNIVTHKMNYAWESNEIFAGEEAHFALCVLTH